MIKGCGHPLPLTNSPKPLPDSSLLSSVYTVFRTQQVMVEDEDEIFLDLPDQDAFCFLVFSGQTNSKQKTKGWTKVIEVIFLKQEEKHICEEEKATFGNSLNIFFPKKGSRKPFSYFTSSVPILDALILLISHLPQDQGRREDIFSIFWVGQIWIIPSCL